MPDTVLVGAFAVLWLASSAKTAFSTAWEMRKLDETAVVKGMVETAAKFREALTDVENLVSSSIIAYVILVLPLFMLFFDVTGFAMVSWKMNFSAGQHVLFLLAVITNAMVYVGLFRVMARIAKVVAREETPEYIEETVLGLMKSLPSHSLVSMTARASKTIMAMYLVLSVFLAG